MKSRRKLTVVLLEEHEKVNYYSIRYQGEQLTEFEKFLLVHKTDYLNDLAIMLERISKIGEIGAHERYFRYAGQVKDRTAELPSHLDTTKLRLYCIRFSEQIVILGNGGIKNTRTYQEDEVLDAYVKTLQSIDLVIKKKEQLRKIIPTGKILSGLLMLYIEEQTK